MPITSVGIFWFVRDSQGKRHLLADGCALANAEPYADCLTFGGGHYETWEHWRTNGGEDRRNLIAGSEYDAWPRGRVVFDRQIAQYYLYADRRITRRAELIAQIMQHFNLPRDAVILRHDAHYK